jgi:hypothetical protein
VNESGTNIIISHIILISFSFVSPCRLLRSVPVSGLVVRRMGRSGNHHPVHYVLPPSFFTTMSFLNRERELNHFFFFVFVCFSSARRPWTIVCPLSMAVWCLPPTSNPVSFGRASWRKLTPSQYSHN